jgi:hypothetical protein
MIRTTSTKLGMLSRPRMSFTKRQPMQGRESMAPKAYFGNCYATGEQAPYEINDNLQ